MNSPLVSVIGAHDFIEATNTVVIDARGGPDAFERYKHAHLPGALFVDLENELSAKMPDAAQGGRHPLPEPQKFARLLTELGITPSTRVLVYDDKSGANAAARFWWMMKAAGHTSIFVLDGSWETISKASIPLSDKIPARKPVVTNYPLEQWQLPTVTMDDIVKATSNLNSLIIDVRESYRYRGESEPIDLVAGHIPGAVNVPYVGNLNDAGEFLPPVELATKYQSVIKSKDLENVMVHCGSGVTACHTLLAMEHAGITGAKLYVGSWSEWSRNNMPIATGEQ